MDLVEIYIKNTIITKFIAFLLLLFFNFALLDPDSGGNIIADPDPQPCLLLLRNTKHILTCHALCIKII